MQLVLVADRVLDDPTERGSCEVLMELQKILPLLPRACSHEPGDSCNPWPPTAAAS